MVELRGKKYGIDISGGRVRIVGRLYSSGRDYLDTMINSYPEYFEQEIVDTEASYYFSISEQDAIIKKIQVKQSEKLDLNQVAQFEIASSLLDGIDQYYLEAYDIGMESERLAIAFHRKMVEKKIDYLKAKISKPSGFGLRSLALVKAYRRFCKKEGSGLTCIMDIDNDRASYCFMYNDFSLQPGSIEKSAGSDERSDNNSVSSSFLLDLAATLKFQLAGLNSKLRALPLTKILLTGYSADLELIGKVEEYTGVPAVIPEMNKELFADEINRDAAKFLVPLGLTLD